MNNCFFVKIKEYDNLWIQVTGIPTKYLLKCLILLSRSVIQYSKMKEINIDFDSKIFRPILFASSAMDFVPISSD